MANERFMEGSIASFSKDMKRLVNQREFSDVKFLVGESKKPIFAHRCLLAYRCEVFRAMFADHSHSDICTPLVLTDVDPDVFLAVLEFLYTNCVTLNVKTAVDLLAASIEYGLDELKHLCIKFLVENINLQNACESMQAAVTYGQSDLQLKAISYIEDNTENVFKTQGFLEMSESAIIEILKSNRLLMDELNILQAVKEWAKINSAVLSKSAELIAKNVVQHIRLSLLSPDELTELEQNNDKNNFIPVSKMAFAWKFHALHQSVTGDEQTRLRRGTRSRECHQGLKKWDA
ncbi:BTB/POZ domain-containing protein 19-like [Antedon mediterranea]|uniref:BTB/POZ domain-containing protein 19-like n=1 Tax=Antedon mediterranea TaxID=105859 RepID=UPI003AF52DEA